MAAHRRYTVPGRDQTEKGAIHMATVSGVSGSNASSIYGNRNVLSGLATGLDTESMVENAVKGYKTKINTLKQKETQITWKQTAFRNLTDPMVQFTRKYTSYTSSTNLFSASYFDNATVTASNGVNASKVSATGKSNSTVKILDVTQLASAAAYRVSGDRVTGSTATVPTVTAVNALDLNSTVDLSAVSGSLTLQYGGRNIDLSFEELDLYQASSDGTASAVDAFVSGIQKKLSAAQVSNGSGELVSAATLVSVSKDASGNIVFGDAQSAGNTVSISAASGKLAATLDITADGTETMLKTAGLTSLTVSGLKGELLSGKSLNMVVNGKTQTITLPAYQTGNADPDAAFVTALQQSVQSKFGTDYSVSLTAGGQLQIVGPKGSTIQLSSSDSTVVKGLGFPDSTATSYLNTSAELGALLSTVSGTGTETLGNASAGTMQGTALTGVGTITKKDDGTYYDSLGQLTDASGNRLGTDGKQLYGYDMVINGVKIGTYTRDTALGTVLRDINSSSAGVTVSYSRITNSFQMQAKETGAAADVSVTGGSSNLATLLFGTVDGGKDAFGNAAAGYTAGRDAVFSMEVNGQQFTNMTRSDNNFDVDGLTLSLKGTFASGTDTAVTFTSTSDTNKITENIKSMVEDFNKIMTSLHSAYSTQPLTKSDNKSRYEPLTDDDKEGMSESAITSYEEKAKTGLLFGDRDLSNLYSSLVDVVQPYGAAAKTLNDMGISATYSGGVTTLILDETALKDALQNNPDEVRDAFTKSSGGLMTGLKTVLDAYASVSSATKGILVEKAGSTYSSLSLLNNTLQDQLGDLDGEIDKWQTRMSDKIDYYSEQFSKLEQLTSEMNSQSSMLSGLLGGK